MIFQRKLQALDEKIATMQQSIPAAGVARERHSKSIAAHQAYREAMWKQEALYPDVPLWVGVYVVL